VYGRAADTVRELVLMDGTGKLLTVTKDFNDYLGREGACFIIIKAKLAVEERKPRTADIILSDTLNQAMVKVNELKEGAPAVPGIGAEKPIAIEYLDEVTATLTGIATKHTIIVEWAGERGAVKHEQHTSLMNRLTNARRRLGDQGHIILEDGKTPPEAFEQALRWCAGKNLPVIADAGQGIIHPFFSRSNEGKREEWYDYLVSIKGSPNGTEGYGLRKKKYMPLEIKNKLITQKERYDYNNVLARGKLVEYV
jgi:FAD/FMN-containing dehydrogenase